MPRRSCPYLRSRPLPQVAPLYAAPICHMVYFKNPQRHTEDPRKQFRSPALKRSVMRNLPSVSMGHRSGNLKSPRPWWAMLSASDTPNKVAHALNRSTVTHARSVVRPGRLPACVEEANIVYCHWQSDAQRPLRVPRHQEFVCAPGDTLTEFYDAILSGEGPTSINNFSGLSCEWVGVKTVYVLPFSFLGDKGNTYTQFQEISRPSQESHGTIPG